MRYSVITLAAPILIAAASAHAGAVTVTPLVMGGDSYHGLSIVASISASENMQVNNSGTWLLEAVATGSVSLIIRGTGTTLPGTVYLAEAESVPPPAPKGLTFNSFDSARLNNHGNASFNIFMLPTGATDAGVFFNTGLKILKGDISTAAGFSPNTPYVGWFETYINDLDQILMIANVDDPAIPTTADPAIVRLDDPAGAATQTVLVKDGDELLPGRFVAGLGTGPHNHAFANGSALVVIDLDGDTVNDGVLALHNSQGWTVVAREGDPSIVVADRNWGTFGSVTGVDINNNGEWVVRGTLNAPLADAR